MQKRRIYFVVILNVVLFSPSIGLCQSRESEARDEFEKGVADFKAGLYEQAARAFRRANRLNPTWSLLFNIAQSEAAAKR